MITYRIYLSLFLFFVVYFSFAQNDPMPRASGHLFYFKPTRSLILVDGCGRGDQGTMIYSDLWEWDGKTWTRVEKGKTYKWDMPIDMFVARDE